MIVWAFETLIASTLLMLLVLALRSRVRCAFGPNIAYALWALPAFRMIMPALPGDWSLSRLVDPIVRPVAEAPGVVMGVMNPATLPPAAQSAIVLDGAVTVASRTIDVALVPPTAVDGGAPVALLILGLWGLGALGFIAYHLIQHSRFRTRVWRQAGSFRTVADGNVAVIETGAAAGPLAFGIWRKYVAFPRDFADRYDPLERDLALAHELGHHARGDLIANWIALVVLGLHWFNPVALRAFRAFRADQEMACDALVLAGRARELRHAYGRAIVKSAHGGAVSAACHLHTINEIKGRLRMLTVHRARSRGQIATGAAAVAVLALTSLGATASGTHAAERVRDRVEKTIGVDLAAMKLPVEVRVPPIPPLVPGAAPADGEPGGRHVDIVVRDADGRVHRYASDSNVTQLADGNVRTSRTISRSSADAATPVPPAPPAPPMPPEALAALRNAPQVLSRRCGGGDGATQNVIHEDGGKRRRIIICTDRIERSAALAARQGAEAGRQADLAARQGEVARRQAEAAGRQAEAAARQSEMARRQAAWAERTAMTAALAGLRNARGNVERTEGLTGEQRAAALAGIDDAIREMEAKD